MSYLLKSWRPCQLWMSLLSVSVIITLTGCNNIQGINTQDTTPHLHTTEHSQPAPSDSHFTKCPAYNPEQTMCTAQYDPVCVTVKTDAGLNYRTAGNSCSACGTTVGLGYVKGPCS